MTLLPPSKEVWMGQRHSSHPCWSWCLPAHVPPQQHAHWCDNDVLDITSLQTAHGMWWALLPHEQHHFGQEGWILWGGACLPQNEKPASPFGCKLCLTWWTGSALMYSRTDPAWLCLCFEEAGQILNWGLLGNANLPSNYLPTRQVGSIACLAARVTWMWTYAAASHLCRFCTSTLLPLHPSQRSLACCVIFEWPLSHSLSHRHREKPRGKVSCYFSGHLPGFTGPTTPGSSVSLCPLLTHSLCCSRVCCRGKSTCSSPVAQSCCLRYKMLVGSGV